MLRSHFTKFC